LFLHEGSFKKGLGQWGRSIGPRPRAHMGFGISVPYIPFFSQLQYFNRQRVTNL